MFQIRRILLSGLVALLMVGMVTAGDITQTDLGMETPDGLVIKFGVWDESHENCYQAPAAECLKIGISIDLTWVRNLFN